MLSLNTCRNLAPSSKYFRVISLNNISNQKNDKTKSKSADKLSEALKNNKKIDSSAKVKDHPSVSVALIGGGLTPAYAALLLKQERIIKSINIGDVGDKSVGLFLDASQIDTSTKIKYFRKHSIKEALRDVEIIALMNEDDFTYGKSNSHAQFLTCSRYVKQVAENILQSSPTALVAVFAQPVTANLPLVSEIYKSGGCWDPDRIIGSLALDSMRLESLAANLLHLNPEFTSIPIVGGADPCTIVPLLSRAKPCNQFSLTQQESLIRSVRASENELAIINKSGIGPNLSMAAAITKLIITLAGGCCGFQNSIASAYVRSNVLPACRYFANELQFGPGGVSKNFGLPKISSNEIELIEQVIPIINANTDLAVNFMKEIHKKKICDNV